MSLSEQRKAVEERANELLIEAVAHEDALRSRAADLEGKINALIGDFEEDTGAWVSEIRVGGNNEAATVDLKYDSRLPAVRMSPLGRPRDTVDAAPPSE